MKWLGVIAGAVVLPLLLLAPLLGMLSDPWAPWQFQAPGYSSATSFGGNSPIAMPAPPPIILNPTPIPGGFVSDVERYALARAAGWTDSEAVIATAISIAEDPAGDPSALSPMNSNGTYDLGLWQINSIHWAKFGGQQALTNPLVNALAGYAIYGPGHNWCAWSTYLASCGPGHTGSYAAFLACAQLIASGVPCQH